MMELLADLRDDGDTIDLGDGRALRLKIRPDEGYDPFNETDIYGRIGWGDRNNDYGRERRPKGFTGNAEKISIGRGDMAWWEPPTDVKRSDPSFAKLRSLVVDLAEYGCSYVALELLEGEDAYSRPIVVNVASLGGIDSLADGYLLQVIGELAWELAND